MSVLEPEIESRASIPGQPVQAEDDVEFLHEVGSLLASAEPLGAVLDRVVTFINEVIGADSVFVYVLEGDELVLSASKNPRPDAVDRLKLKVGEGITGWVAQHRKPVAVPRDASSDPRFQAFSELPEDRFEAFLSVPVVARGKLVGVINLQHRMPHMHTRREIQIVSMAGFLGRIGDRAGAARLDGFTPRGSVGDAEAGRARQGRAAAGPGACRGRGVSDPAAAEPATAFDNEGSGRGDRAFGRGAARAEDCGRRCGIAKPSRALERRRDFLPERRCRLCNSRRRAYQNLLRRGSCSGFSLRKVFRSERWKLQSLPSAAGCPHLMQTPVSPLLPLR